MENHESKLLIRHGRVLAGFQFWSETWGLLVESTAKFLPPMDIPLNKHGRPGIVVPWEERQKFLKPSMFHHVLETPMDYLLTLNTRE
jgi:hypothetical protein